MEFTRKDKKDFISDLMDKDFFSRKCYLCNRVEWEIDVGYKGEAAFKYLNTLGCKDGYALVCRECFDKYFRGHECKAVSK